MISSIGPPQHWVQPSPEVTIRFCPRGCVCQAERAPGSNVTLPTETREGSWAWTTGSMRTVPVKYSSGPFWEGRDPLRWISIFQTPCLGSFGLRLLHNTHLRSAE